MSCGEETEKSQDEESLIYDPPEYRSVLLEQILTLPKELLPSEVSKAAENMLRRPGTPHPNPLR